MSGGERVGPKQREMGRNEEEWGRWDLCLKRTLKFLLKRVLGRQVTQVDDSWLHCPFSVCAMLPSWRELHTPNPLFWKRLVLSDWLTVCGIYRYLKTWRELPDKPQHTGMLKWPLEWVVWKRNRIYTVRIHAIPHPREFAFLGEGGSRQGLSV